MGRRLQNSPIAQFGQSTTLRTLVVAGSSPVRGSMYEKTFKIRWDEGLGRDWMNVFNLKLVL